MRLVLGKPSWNSLQVEESEVKILLLSKRRLLLFEAMKIVKYYMPSLVSWVRMWWCHSLYSCNCCHGFHSLAKTLVQSEIKSLNAAITMPEKHILSCINQCGHTASANGRVSVSHIWWTDLGIKLQCASDLLMIWGRTHNGELLYNGRRCRSLAFERCQSPNDVEAIDIIYSVYYLTALSNFTQL
jgi:hypothetical protein